MAERLRGEGHDVALLELSTTGDRRSADGGEASDRGLFVKELEEALLDGRADLAVHSAKDVPTGLPEGLAILAVPARADARDVLVGCAAGIDGLTAGARVATGSPRRQALLRTARPDIAPVAIRGNVDTRLRRLDEGAADALVLAAAGLARLGIVRSDAVALDPARFVPAPGQGVLAIEGRTDRADLAAAVAALEDPVARRCLTAERAVLAGFGGGCSEPIGAHCVQSDDGELLLRAFVSRAADEAGTLLVAVDGLDDPAGLGEDVADALRAALRSAT